MAKSYNTRIHRLLKIFNLIQSSPGWNAERLSAECKTSVRNIYRDMTVLEAAGIPYFFDKESGSYSIRKDFFMPAVELTLEESLALVALTDQVAEKEQVPFMKPAARAVAKIRSQLPAKIRDALGEKNDQVELHLARASSGEGVEDVYEQVRRAILNRLALRCRYESASKKSKARDEEFVFKPYKLYFCQRAWYAVGRHEARGEVRSLRLNRFSSIKDTTKAYAIPADFSLQKHLGHAWRMIRGDKTYQVELYFDADFADTIADTHWHATQETEPADDDGLIFRCKVDGLSEIMWWVLSMGRHCTVRKPAELAELVKQEARAMLEVYEPQGKRADAEVKEERAAAVRKR